METTITQQKRTEIASFLRRKYSVYIPIESDVSVSNISGLFFERKYFVPSTIIEYIYHMFYVKLKCDHIKKHRRVEYGEFYNNVINNFENNFLEKLIEMFKINMDDNVSLAIGIYYIIINGTDYYKYSKKIVKYLSHSSLFGNCYASCLLGRYLSHFPNNKIYNCEKLTIRLLLHSIDNGDVPEAMFSYASLYFDGLSGINGISNKYNHDYKKNYLHTQEQLLQYYKLAAKIGIIEACYDVGLYFINNGDYAKGIKYITKGIGCGCSVCIIELNRLITNKDIFVETIARIYHNTSGNTCGKKLIIFKLFYYIALGNIVLNKTHNKFAKKIMPRGSMYKLEKSLKSLILLCETAISEKIQVSYASYILGIAYSDTNKDMAIKYYHTYINDLNKNKKLDYAYYNIKILKMYCEKLSDTTLIGKLNEYDYDSDDE